MKGFFYAKSEYSLLDSTISLLDLVKKSKEYGYSFVALTDKSLFGAYKFVKECENAAIKPIIGLEVTVNEDIILLYAINNIGYKNLLAISSFINSNKEIDFETLRKNSLGMICVISGIESKFYKLYMNNQKSEAFNNLKEYMQIYDKVYVGLQKQFFPQDIFYDDIKSFLIERNIKYLPIHKTLFLDKNDLNVYSVIKKIDGVDIEESNYIDCYLKKIEELDTEFLDDDVYRYVDEVYSSVDIKISKVSKSILNYPNSANILSKDYLSELCYLGLKKRLNNIYNKEYENRLIHELDVITKLHFEDYFLIVYDFVRYAKKNNILIGQGRGSAAGSLVAYLLGITNVDPLKYDLLFERFLNPSRVTMPDIDIDIPSDRRLEVIDYLINKYGVDRVCMISTFDTFKGKSSINDVSKALSLKEYEVDEIVKKCQFIDEEGKSKITKESIISALASEENLKLAKAMEICSKIYGLPKSLSTHASGVILSNDPLLDNVPLIEANGYMQSQFDAHDLEDLGLLKMDLLSLKNLTMLDLVLKETKIKLENIPLDDRKTYELLSSADTSGIFQLDGKGIRGVLKKYKPTEFSDIVAILALYRPGPMDEINEFIARKNGKKFNYPNDKLEGILKITYGIIVYQEQIMRIAHEYAGLSMADADLLRRAISKKDSKTLDDAREKFIANCLNKEEANKIYDYIVKFANYGFNKSHTVCYAMLSYYMAYLKANYPKEFIVSFLNDSSQDLKGSLEYYSELRKNNVNVLNPNINISTNKYIVKDNDVILPLSMIKTLSSNSVQTIIDERKNGLFNSFSDFYSRVKLGRDEYINLIFASAFDGIKKDMVKLLDNRNAYLDDIINDEEYEDEILLDNEIKALGFNLKYSIIDRYGSDKEKYNCTNISSINDIGEYVVISHIKAIKKITTKKNDLMAFVELYDSKYSIEVTLFPDRFNDVFEVIERFKPNVDVFRLKIKAYFRGNELSFELLDAFKY